jgi:Ca2+/Na+ antiporter
MNKKQQAALSLNALGVALFVIWLVVRNQLPSILSIALAVVFLALLGASLFLLIRAAKSVRETKDKSDMTKNE